MRNIPSRMVSPTPAQIKKGSVAQIQGMQAPIKGLDRIGVKDGTGDPLTATILINWSIIDDHIQVRPGTKLIHDHYPTGTRFPIVQLMPYLDSPQHILASTNHTVVKAATGTLVRGGFGSDEWHWTMFANLSQNKYLVMVNGVDGVWSYDGLGTDPGGPVAVTSISAAKPPVVTVGAADIAKFSAGGRVVIAGGASGYSVCNGWQTIGIVSGNTFTLAGLDTTGAGASGAGITADPQAGMVKEDVRAGTGMPFCNPNNFQIVCPHINRLYFADQQTLAVYYLPLQSKGGPTTGDPLTDPGVLSMLPLNAVFKRGGYVKAVASWTVDGGNGMDDKLVIFSSNGECAIYTGIDPADDNFGLIGVYRFDAPMNRYCTSNYGGDLWVLTSTGLAPLTTLMRAETEKLTKAEHGTIELFRNTANKYPTLPGWYVILNSTTGAMVCNMPMGSANKYDQMVRNMPDPVWQRIKDVPARCMTWMTDRIWIGSDDGKFYDFHRDNLSDDGKAITAEVRMAWQTFKTPASKQFNLLRIYGSSNGTLVKPSIDIAVNYIDRPPEVQPDVIQQSASTPWGSPWGSPWSGLIRPAVMWGGVGRRGSVGAPHVKVSVLGATYSISRFDIVYEQGSIL